MRKMMKRFLVFCLMLCACYSNVESMDIEVKKKFDESINYGVPLPRDVSVKKFEKMRAALPKQSTRNVANVMIAQRYFRDGNLDKAAELMKDTLSTEEGQTCLFSCQILESTHSDILLRKIDYGDAITIEDVLPLLTELAQKEYAPSRVKCNRK